MLLNDIKQINEELAHQRKQILILDDKADYFFSINVVDISDPRAPKTIIDPLLLSRGNSSELIF